MSSLIDPTVSSHVQERFETRARALLYARLALMAIGLGVLIVPAWRRALGITLPVGAYWYLGLLAYQVASYVWIGRRFDRAIIFVTLCLDLLVVLFLVTATGGIKSQLMPTQLILTMLFALLYPSPLAIIPPLLTLPVVAKVDQVLGIQTLPGDLLLVLWYSALNVVVVYITVYLEGRERTAFQEVIKLQRQRRQSALDSERTRIAREIHDSVGASLSGVILQAEYMASQVEEAHPLQEEIQELRDAASEGMEELRRAVSMMRHEFQMVSAMQDYVAAYSQRHRLEAAATVTGVEREMDPERHLVLFRILQEALTNIAQHAGATRASVHLSYEADEVRLEITDDGKGFDPEAMVTGHYGLRNMCERAEKVGGSTEISSEAGQGASITVRVPHRTPGNSPR